MNTETQTAFFPSTIEAVAVVWTAEAIAACVAACLKLDQTPIPFFADTIRPLFV